ncbi:lysylphosphatidylglycerol synthase domain-containing protein, partial [Xanthomonas graminis]
MTDTASPASPSPAGWRRALPVVFSLAILALALCALATEFSTHGYAAIRHAFNQLGVGQIALTLVLGLSSYACLIGFDAVGLHRSGRKLHPMRIGVTAFLAHAVGQTLGFAALTGGAVRLRGYGRAGLSLAEIGQVVLMSTLGFVFGAWLLLALALTLEPTSAALALPLGGQAVRAFGIALLAGFGLMLLLAGREGRTLRWRSHELWLPDRRTALGVTALSVVELGLASAAFYVLLPNESGIEFVGFVGLYLVAVVAGLMSTVPAGLGVFEWSLLKLLPGVAPAAVLAAALIYRITYYVVPLLLSVLMAAV